MAALGVAPDERTRDETGDEAQEATQIEPADDCASHIAVSSEVSRLGFFIRLLIHEGGLPYRQEGLVLRAPSASWRESEPRRAFSSRALYFSCHCYESPAAAALLLRGRPLRVRARAPITSADLPKRLVLPQALKGRKTGLKYDMPRGDSTITSVDVVLPVYNEEAILAASVAELHEFLSVHCQDLQWCILIADNASSDGTREVAGEVCRRYSNVAYLYCPTRGRGWALRTAWSSSSADIVGYMDVDLSTNLNSLPVSIMGLCYGFDIAIGNRLMQGARITRRWKREVISRGYNTLAKALHWNHFSDAQCGFKFLKRSVALDLLPSVKNNNWFFDTELLLKGEWRKYRILEVPVEWVEDLDSKVRIIPTAIEDVFGLLRVWWEKLRHTNV